MDIWTSNELENMVRYIADDRRIATHLGIPIEVVAKFRGRLPKNRRDQSVAIAKDAPLPPDTFAAECRRGSRLLSDAIERMLSPQK